MRSSQLNDAHDISDFDCGVDELTAWLHRFARPAYRAGTANTFVWTRGGAVVAYYTIAAHMVVRDMLPTAGLRGAPETIPAYIIGKLALDRSLRGQQRGEVLLWDALERCVANARGGAAAKVIVIDAINEHAKRLYSAHMTSVPNDPSRFYVKISTAEKALERSGA